MKNSALEPWVIDPNDQWLSIALEKWAKAAGLSLMWSLDVDYPLVNQKPRCYSGSLEAALAAVQADVDRSLQSRTLKDAIEVYLLPAASTGREAIELKSGTDGTQQKLWASALSEMSLRQTLVRWGSTASWDVDWSATMQIPNLGLYEVRAVNFPAAAAYVLNKTQAASRLVGIDLKYKFEGHVLSVWQENPK
jgi:hypothetical protein